MNKRILIFGSCVSRDPFGDPVDIKLGFDLKDYYARTSFASLSGHPLENTKLQNISSSFQRKMVERDFSKDFIDFNFNSIDLILVDFIDDRFPLLKMKNGSMFTESPEFLKSGLSVCAKKIEPFSDEFFEHWKSGWCQLLIKLKETGDINKLLINKCYLACRDDNGRTFEQVSYISKFNLWLEKIYDYLMKYIPKEQFVDYSMTKFIAKADHRWGRSPFHYTRSVENALLAHIRYFAGVENIHYLTDSV